MYRIPWRQRRSGFSTLLKRLANPSVSDEPAAASHARGIVEAILSCSSSSSSSIRAERFGSCQDGPGYGNGDSGRVQMLLSRGHIREARSAFDNVARKNVVLYTAMIGGYSTCDPLEAVFLFRRMQLEGVAPNRITFVQILAACVELTSVQLGQLLHVWIAEAGIDSDSVLGTALLNMYGKCGSFSQAEQAFENILRKDVVSWNAIILVCIRHGRFVDARSYFRRMQLEGVRPNRITFITILSISNRPKDLAEGKLLHELASQSGHDCNIAVGNAIVNMYAKCEALHHASETFNRIADKNVVTWNVMISAHAQLGDSDQALLLFHHMLLQGIRAKETTFLNILNAFNSPAAALKGGALIQACVLEQDGSRVDIVVATALMTMFAKCGDIHRAGDLFHAFQQQHPHNLVLWNAILAAYVQHELFDVVLLLYRRMQLQGVHPDGISFLSAINACAAMEDLPLGRHLHARLVQQGIDSDVVLATALTNMYSKCGSLVDARTAFDRITSPDLVAWNVLMAAHVENREHEEAFRLFQELERSFKPDRIAFITILGACATSSYLPQGRLFHDRIIRVGLESNVVVATALVDMYGKCGNLEEAFRIFSKTDGRTVITWNSLIAGYAQHGRASQVPELVHQMQQEGVNPDEVTFTGVMSACSHAGLLEDGCKYMAALVEDQHITPVEEHYGCLIDLLGRAGKLKEAEEFLTMKMPLPPTAATWTSLLSACSFHGDIELAKRAARRVLELDPHHTGAFVVLSNSMLQEGLHNIS